MTDSHSMPWNKPVEKEDADMRRKDCILWSQRISLRFPSYFQLQNVDLQIILLSVLDPWILMYTMNVVDKPGWSILKETRADCCTVEPSLAEDVVFNPNCR